jgi:hypothetical protein
MNLETEKDSLMRRYLLGEMSDEERTDIEEKFLADDSFFEEIAALEDELYLDYQQGNLSAAGKIAFEKKFLATDADLNKAEFAEVFLEATNEISAEKTAPSLWKSIVAFFDFSNTFRLATAAASILLLCLLGVWVFNNLNQTPEIVVVPEEINTPSLTPTPNLPDENLIKEKQKEQAELEKKLQEEKQKREQDANKIREIEKQKEKINREIEANRQRTVTPESEPRTFVALVLSPLVRGGNGNSPKVKLTPDTKTLNLTLSVKKGSEAENIKIVVRSVSGGQIWSSSAKPNQKKSIFLSLPAKNLKRGDYEILTSADGEELDSYYFSVEK